VGAAIVLAAAFMWPHRISRREITTCAAAVAAAAVLAGPLAYSVQTIVTPHKGGIVAAGPTVADAGLPQMPTPDAPAGALDGGPGMTKTAVTKQISRMLSEDGDSYTWVAAANGANDAAAY
jgi:hypothetical protein